MKNQPEPDQQSTVSLWNSLQNDTQVSDTSQRPNGSEYKLPDDSDFLRGVTFNGPNGPYKCSRQVFRILPNAAYSIQSCRDISTEEFYPANDADARYIHMGWPAPSELSNGSWETMYRDSKVPSGTGNLVCRRMVVHRWTISCRIEDLEACEDFAKAIEEALKEPNATDQVEALREIFATWGEMISLCAVMGASLAASGTLGLNQTLTGDAATFRPPDRGPDIMQMIDQNLDITGNFERRFESRIQASLTVLDYFFFRFNSWLTNAMNLDNSATWEVVKVSRAAPVTDLLPKSLQQKVKRLLSYANMISRSPAVGSQIPFGFDGASLGMKDIKQINVWHNGLLIQDISIVYTDGALAGPHGFGKSNQISDSFALARGEFITDVFTWATASSINAIQFIKNTTQLSARYGLHSGVGDPNIFTAGGNGLLGLSGSFNVAQLLQLQAVWRSDVKEDEYRIIATSTIGTGSGAMFNDYRFLGHPPTSRISSIAYRSTATVVAGFAVTYSSTRDGNETRETTPIRGTDAGARDIWTLEEDEYITQVKGRYSGSAVYKLEFTTNKGNTKKIGQEAGDWFTFAPPHNDMVLYYMIGKSAGYMQTMTFVWGMPPLKDPDSE
ncbi:unnamed protein product [Rhizoctonia solani]|uniref:Jacalin-type lectin domain-containing protein n=1 Tax=Rhizoctonia solani TaxID=456999 RepID=A0A8H3H9M4_9AGAM|nr:unnamed protein product [Rhizoctonia solani]